MTKSIFHLTNCKSTSPIRPERSTSPDAYACIIEDHPVLGVLKSGQNILVTDYLFEVEVKIQIRKEAMRLRLKRKHDETLFKLMKHHRLADRKIATCTAKNLGVNAFIIITGVTLWREC